VSQGRDLRVERFRRVLDGAVEATGETFMANGGWDPRPGSQGAAELEAQGPFLGGWSRNPVKDAHGVAGLRLSAAAQLVHALSRLLLEPACVMGAAAVARVILENSARASWALDPSLDVRMRIARGRTEVIRNLSDALSYPLPRREVGVELTPEQEKGASVREETEAKLDAILDDTTNFLNLEIRRDRRGRFLGVEENAPRPTDTIMGEFGQMGAIAYRDLSGVAHGGLSGLIGRLDEITSVDDSTLMGPAADASGRLPHLAASLTAYASASERRIRLFGWDATKWIAWRLPSLDVIREVFDEQMAD
jgi:hypothetical protein